MNLLDICILDVTSTQFSYSVIAAAVICHLIPEEIATHVIGSLLLPDIERCLKWMEPFVDIFCDALFKEDAPDLKVQSSCTNIFKHDDSLDMLVLVKNLIEENTLDKNLDSHTTSSATKVE